jgi:hypothetical protein
MDEWIPEDTFGARLALIRQHLGGWNVKRAADFCGIDDQQWRNWESGRNRPRDYPVVCRRICSRTGVALSWLMMGGPPRPPSTKWYSESTPAQAAA